MTSILEGYFKRTLTLCRIKKLHRERSIGVELKSTQTTLHVVEDVGIGHSNRTLQHTTRYQLHMLIVHIKTSSARISKHFRIHHRALGSILNEDLHHGLIDIGTLCILTKSDSQHDSDT